MQVQLHGFKWENEIKSKVYGLPIEKNNTEIHDIPRTKNKVEDANVSIKTTGSETVCCGDVLRFYDYNFNETNQIIIVKYKQEGTEKVLKEIIEVEYTKEMHEHLFGMLTRKDLEEFEKNVKNVPKSHPEINRYRKEIQKEKKEVTKNTNSKIVLNPKIDSKEQRRVQCSFKLKDVEKFIVSRTTQPVVKGVRITERIESAKRTFT